ncbi:YbjQ family protein [Salegentibacter sp. F188]|uniref:UPF0145 protein RM549_14510 n=1 Tax=Autumnicola patrickiae TaxID=3075591 RepID=A0ABU3E5T4_9FLAO|nr:YbjQ family protein [Salegentibacter sp. F188]MDT0691004.1 YbjQ family protein [Salegentibacter sp. F188]
MKKEVLVITTDNPSEGKIVKHLRPVTAHVVAGTNLFSDFFAGMSDIFGGRSGSYKKQLSSIYDEAIERVKQEAKRMGANGVVGLKIDIDEISGQGKSMFMITAIGTAVVIKETKDKIEPFQSSNGSSKELNRVDNENIQRLSRFKILKEKADHGQLKYDSEVWEFLIQYRIKDFFPFILRKLGEILDNPSHHTTESLEYFRENTTIYIKALDIDDQIDLIYSALRNKEITPKVDFYLRSIIKEELLLNFDRVKIMLQDDDLEVKKRGMNVGTYDRPYYSNEDARNYKELIQLIQSAFPKRGSLTTKKQLLSSKDKEAWECECGKVNDMDITYCTRCSLNIYGFDDREPKPEKSIAIIENKISLLTESLEAQQREQSKV